MDHIPTIGAVTEMTIGAVEQTGLVDRNSYAPAKALSGHAIGQRCEILMVRIACVRGHICRSGLGVMLVEQWKAERLSKERDVLRC
jgi:hypothetical protein